MKTLSFGETIGIIANLGVIAGIVFLSLEIRQNNEQLSAQSRFNYYQNRISEYWTIAQDGELIAIVQKANAGLTLTPVEEMRVSNRMMALLTGWEYEFGEMAAGRLLEAEFNPAAKRQVFQTIPSLAAAWEQYRSVAPPTFTEFMDRHIANP